ncbi:hypothetical protein L226DRAFT_42836 [Lentinus tigrinus ALCF2SS1-7]|uniref:Uncharacterized protein n=1 Tax=Lentinus tigrinus ALCF2SS1-6 TaxID=1328759 RepID=A0A5C2RNH1_9APHY|nr:hypothetical protein L227DRAFT_617222 [Lentinus tigrinus ALCF2SS1-6]RPD75361.1 hypothetical protein L226DRAFT_42836 [Lentinus tigrinus ALCF2SS1-7]
MRSSPPPAKPPTSSPASTVGSAAVGDAEIVTSNNDEAPDDSDKAPLIDDYPDAYSDFYGTGLTCIFKSGPAWLVHKNPGVHAFKGETRLVQRYVNMPKWFDIAEAIYLSLNSIKVKWTTIDAVSYAHAGEAKPFCPLIISIGVRSGTLLYDDAKRAAVVVKEILANAGFPDIEVAFLESEVADSAPCDPSLGNLPIPSESVSPSHEGTA